MNKNTHTEQPEPTVPEALTNVLEYLWEDERRAYHAAPPGERSGYLFRSLRVLQRHHAIITAESPSDRKAWAVVRQLLEAYTRGEAEGGHIDWDDVDLAYELACEAQAERAGVAAFIPRSDEDTCERSARTEMRALARSLAARASEEPRTCDVEALLRDVCSLTGFVLGLDRLERRREQGRALDPSGREQGWLDGLHSELAQRAAHLVDDDDHDGSFDEDLEIACAFATRFQELDAALSAGAPLPTAWGRPRA